MKKVIPKLLLSGLMILVTGIPLVIAQAVNVQSGEIPEEITITIDEALQIALINNYMLRKGLLDIETAEAQIREAWGSVYPQVAASGNYTRNLQTPNPFAGSDAGGLFETLGALEWLAFNEAARTDGDPNTEPIPIDEFFDRQRAGFEEAGVTPPGLDGGNPFAVENQFQFGISVNQTIYNGAAFAAIRGARQVRELNEEQIKLDQQNVADQIRTSFYTALLAKEQVNVLRSSVERLRETVEETAKAVQAGILSKYDRISAEVELVNLETSLIEVENQSELAVKNLALQLGIPTKTKVNLRGSLEYNDSMLPETLDSQMAYEIALQQRPDVRQTDGLIELLNVEQDITRSGYLPTVSAFANAAYIGQVPSNRTTVRPVEGQDFTFTSESRRFFDNSYWNPAVAVGIQFNWTIFNGFQTRMRVEQNKISIRQAEIDKEFQKNAIYLEIDQAVKNLENSLRRIQSQERNIEQAKLNYEFALSRLQEGVGTPLQERQASSLLDQSRVNYLSAVYDYLVALSNYEKAIGKPILND
ncbi:MAG: TolC family protein [Balneolaceae bacterium]|nr:TolC family protein [Balneolaceae bacterium]